MGEDKKKKTVCIQKDKQFLYLLTWIFKCYFCFFSVTCSTVCASALMHLSDLQKNHGYPVSFKKLEKAVGNKDLAKSMGFWIKRGIVEETHNKNQIMFQLPPNQDEGINIFIFLNLMGG